MKFNKILFSIAAVLLGSFTSASSHVDPSDRSHAHPELSGQEGAAAIEEQIHAILDNTLPQLTDAVSALINHAVDQATQNMVPIEEVERRIVEATQNMVPIEEVERRIAEATYATGGEEEMQSRIQEAVREATQGMISKEGVIAKAECKALGEDILNAFDVFAGSATWNCYCGAWSGIDKISNRGVKFDIRHSAFQVENKDHEMKGTAGLRLQTYVDALHDFAAKLDIDWEED
jgi:hypothetical protein